MNLGRATNFCDYDRDNVASRGNETWVPNRKEVRRTRRRSGEKPGASTWNAVIYRPNACTDLLSQELTSGRDPGLLAADERWRVSVNVGSTRCANYYTFAKLSRIYTSWISMILLDGIVHDECDKRSRLPTKSRVLLTFSLSRSCKITRTA